MLKPLTNDEFLRSSIDLDRSTKRCRLGKVIYRPGGYWGPIVSPYYELFGILSGDAVIEIEGREISVPVNHVALIPPDQHVMRRFSLTNDTHQIWFAFLPVLIPVQLRELSQDVPPCLPMSAAFRHLLDAGFSIHRANTEWAKLFLENLVPAMLAEYIRMAGKPESVILTQTPVRRAVDYFEMYYNQEGCLEGAIRASGVTDRHLIKCFRAELDITPERFLWQLRTVRGIELLRETGLTIGEIAFQCGFKNPFHFSRLVRLHQGVSPRELRKRRGG